MLPKLKGVAEVAVFLLVLLTGGREAAPGGGYEKLTQRLAQGAWASVGQAAAKLLRLRKQKRISFRKMIYQIRFELGTALLCGAALALLHLLKG
jgi:hypothetical protein